LAWIFAVSIFCYRGRKTKHYPKEQDYTSNNARNKNNRNKSSIVRNPNANHLILQRTEETEQILMRLVRGEKVSKALAKLSFSNSSDLSSNTNNTSTPEDTSIDLATADNLSCALSAAFPDFLDAEYVDYFNRSLYYFSNTLSKFSYNLLLTSWIILVILLLLETLTNDSSLLHKL
jgi:hypothetical protein